MNPNTVAVRPQCGNGVTHNNPLINNKVQNSACLRLLRQLLSGNPFYPISALLLLYGIYRLTTDQAIFPIETDQLIFNFGAMQFYEVLMVGTAILLAGRLLWYDSAVLVFLENMLVFVPFILLGQAIFLDWKLTWTMAAVGAGLAVGKHWSLRRGIRELNVQPRLTALGLGFLVVNLAFPIVYRQIHSSGDALSGEGFLHGAIKEGWWVLIPALEGGANLLPKLAAGNPLPVGRPWLPLVFVSLWTAATGVHLAAIGYVHSLPWQWLYVVPTLWVAAWTLYLRREDVLAGEPTRWSRAMLAPPVVVAWGALVCGSAEWSRYLCALNVLAFAWLCWLQPKEQFRLHMLGLSLMGFVASIPEAWTATLAMDFTRGLAVGWSVAGYLVLLAILSRNPKWGVVAALAVFIGLSLALRHHPESGGIALHLSGMLFLAHSLQWDDRKHPGAAGLRWVTAGLWLANAWLWGWSSKSGFLVWGPGLVLAACVVLKRWGTRQWGPWAVSGAALAGSLASPTKLAVEQMHTVSAGPLALAASFALFAAGTALALTRHRWDSDGSMPDGAPDSPMPPPGAPPEVPLLLEPPLGEATIEPTSPSLTPGTTT